MRTLDTLKDWKCCSSSPSFPESAAFTFATFNKPCAHPFIQKKDPSPKKCPIKWMNHTRLISIIRVAPRAGSSYLSSPPHPLTHPSRDLFLVHFIWLGTKAVLLLARHNNLINCSTQPFLVVVENFPEASFLAKRPSPGPGSFFVRSSPISTFLNV